MPAIDPPATVSFSLLQTCTQLCSVQGRTAVPVKVCHCHLQVGLPLVDDINSDMRSVVYCLYVAGGGEPAYGQMVDLYRKVQMSEVYESTV